MARETHRPEAADVGPSRREILRCGALGLSTAAFWPAQAEPGQQAELPPFVLIHGSWHGGWCWRKLTPLLIRAGFPVHTLTLTGLADRAHLLTRDVGLETHVQDVASFLEFEDLRGAVLVGHSYAGLVIGAVAEKAARRIGRLVYLDAFIPGDGQSMFDHDPGFKRFAEANARDLRGVKVLPAAPPLVLGVTDARDSAWMKERLSPQPLLTYSQPVSMPEGKAKKLPRSFIWCSGWEVTKPAAAQARQEAWDFHEIKSGHDVMVTRPDELAQILTGIARPQHPPAPAAGS